LTTPALITASDVYGVSNFCTWSNDVFLANAAIPEAAVGARYENVGLNGPYVSDVVKAAVPLRNWVAHTSGYDIEHLFGRYCDTGGGRLAYYYYTLNHVFGGICQNMIEPGGILDTP